MRTGGSADFRRALEGRQTLQAQLALPNTLRPSLSRPSSRLRTPRHILVPELAGVLRVPLMQADGRLVQLNSALHSTHAYTQVTRS
jgi:hypothetical protein